MLKVSMTMYEFLINFGIGA